MLHMFCSEDILVLILSALGPQHVKFAQHKKVTRFAGLLLITCDAVLLCMWPQFTLRLLGCVSLLSLPLLCRVFILHLYGNAGSVLY